MKTKKTCNQCGIEQLTTEFNKRTAAKDGLQQKCKTCCRANSKYFRDVLRPDYYWGGDKVTLSKTMRKQSYTIRITLWPISQPRYTELTYLKEVISELPNVTYIQD